MLRPYHTHPIPHTAPHQLQPTTNQQRYILQQQQHQQQLKQNQNNSSTTNTFFTTLASIFKPSSPPTTQVFSMATVPEQTIVFENVDRRYVKSQGLRSGSPPLRRVDSPWIYDWRSSLIK